MANPKGIKYNANGCFEGTAFARASTKYLLLKIGHVLSVTYIAPFFIVVVKDWYIQSYRPTGAVAKNTTINPPAGLGPAVL